MKVILIKDFDKLGKINDAIEVSDSYALNFLVPRQIAVIASDKAMSKLNEDLAQKKAHSAALKVEAEKLKLKIEAITLNFHLHSFHSKLSHRVSSKKIYDELVNNYDLPIEKKQIMLSTPLNKIGNFLIKIKLYAGVIADLKVNIVEESN